MCIKGACTFLAGKFLIFKQPIIKYVSQNRDETLTFAYIWLKVLK